MRALDLYQKSFSAIQTLLSRFHSDFSAALDRGQVLPKTNLADLRKEFAIKKMSLDEIQNTLNQYLSLSTQVAHPRFMGHQVSNPHPAALMGDLAQSLSNNSIAVQDMGRAGIAIERNLIDWFLGKIGWSADSAGGILTHGGSMANLTALLAARGNRFPNSWVEGVEANTVMIAPEASHYCVNRSASIMGLGSRGLRLVKCQPNGTMDVVALRETIEVSIRAGEKICAVVATAACTATGAFDSLLEIGQIVKSHDLWFHVDGAHGASALVSKKHAPLLRGIELADSIVWDAHKMLRAPSLCTAVLFKNRSTMEKIFAQDAPYLSRDNPGEWELRHPFLYTLECTRPSLGLKFYPVLCALGDEGLETYVDYTFALAKEAHVWINEQPDMESPFDPQSNIVVFRLKGVSDEDHSRIYQKVLSEASFHITFTRFQGQNYLRLSLMNPETTMKDIKDLMAEVRRLV